MKKPQKLLVVLTTMLVAVSLFAYAAFADDATGTTLYGNTTDDKCFYERMVELPNGELLATWCREFPVVTNWQGMKSFYFYKSSDQGKTWNQISELDPEVYDGISRDKIGMPGLYVLPQQMGDYPAGTILFAVSDWNVGSEYCVHIWSSTDGGATWSLHGNLAPRGNNTTSVWEPEFTVSADGRLVCYYSDERQPGYDQCLALEISDDGGRTWNDYKIIAGVSDPNWIRGESPSMWRPGMPRVVKLNNGLYFMAYENIAAGHNGIITCRTSTDGINWGDLDTVGTPVRTADGNEAHQCPEIACIDDGSTYGRIILRGMNDTCSPSKCFTSTDAGQTWQLIDAPLTAVRDESYGSSWSGTFVASQNRLYELNNAHTDSYNEIRFGSGVVLGDQLIVDGADYKLVNAATNYCIDDEAGSLKWGTNLILWEDNGLKTQSWHTKRLTNDVFSLLCNFSSLAMDNPEASQNNGTQIRQWEPNGAAAQGWIFVRDSDGAYRIRNQASGLYLDTENQSTDSHANLVQNSYSDSLTQKWYVERIYEVARFISHNISDCKVYHDSNNRVLIANASAGFNLASSQWRIVPGLASSEGVSFESVDRPGYYLRHCDGKLSISEKEDSDLFNADATWLIRTALDSKDGVSLESYNIAGRYIRHQNSYLIISEISSELDKNDASFTMVTQ